MPNTLDQVYSKSTPPVSTVCIVANRIVNCNLMSYMGRRGLMMKTTTMTMMLTMRMMLIMKMTTTMMMTIMITMMMMMTLLGVLRLHAPRAKQRLMYHWDQVSVDRSTPALQYMGVTYYIHCWPHLNRPFGV